MTTVDGNSQNIAESLSELSNSNITRSTQTNAPTSSSWLGRSWVAKIYSHLTLDSIAQAGIAGSVILGAKTSYSGSETQKLEGLVVATLGAGISCLAWAVGSSLQGKHQKAHYCILAATALSGITQLTAMGNNLIKSDIQLTARLETIQKEANAELARIAAIFADQTKRSHVPLKSPTAVAAKIAPIEEPRPPIEEPRPPLEEPGPPSINLIQKQHQNAEDLSQNVNTASKALNMADPARVTLLRTAIKNHDITGVKELIKDGVNINGIEIKNKLPYPPFFHAVEQGDEEIFNILLQANADINLQDWMGETALFVATRRKLPNIAQTLIQAKADVNIKNKFGITPLMEAAEHWDEAQPSILKALIRANADLNTRDWIGSTALIKAAKFGHLKNVEMLLQAGADPTIKEHPIGIAPGQTALDYALRKRDNPNLAALLRRHLAT